MADETPLTSTEASVVLGISASYLQKLRVANAGPRYSTISPRGDVRYLRSDLMAWWKAMERRDKTEVMGVNMFEANSGVQVEEPVSNGNGKNGKKKR